MLVLVVALQRCAQNLARLPTAWITMLDQFVRIALPGHNGSDDLHAGLAGDIRHDMVQLQVHLHQGLLHVLDLRGTKLKQTLTLTHVRAQCDNLLPGPEARAQQAVFMQQLYRRSAPSGGLAAASRDHLGGDGIDQRVLDSGL